MADADLQGLACPQCKKVALGGFSVGLPERERPRQGDFAFCADCGNWGVLDGDQLRDPTIAETREIFNDVEALHMMALWALTQVMQQRPPTTKH